MVPRDQRVAGSRLRRAATALTAALDAVTPARVYLVVLITCLIILHGVVPTSFAVDGTTIGLLGVLLVVVLVPLLKSATLPGGGGLNFREEIDRLQREAEAAEEEQIDIAGLPEDKIEGIAASPEGLVREQNRSETEIADDRSVSIAEVEAHVLGEAARSPRVGLMVLSAELERAVRRLLLASGWATSQSVRSLRQGVSRLVELGVLTQSSASALALFTDVRNEIVHGVVRATDEEVLRAIDAGLTLLRAVSAIPRERNFVAHVGLDVFADSEAKQRVDDVSALVLRTVSPGGASISFRVFPTTRTDYRPGQELSWVWGSSQWGPAWYRNPATAEIEPAWTGSMEFIGRPLD